jgi:hypothetical protein
MAVRVSARQRKWFYSHPGRKYENKSEKYCQSIFALWNNYFMQEIQKLWKILELFNNFSY